MKKHAYIIAAKRTPTGGFLGSLSQHSAPQLGNMAIRAALSEAGVEPRIIDSVYFGNVLSAGLGQSPARQAALLAGLPFETDATTINKVCSSGMKAVILGAQQIELGNEEAVVTGGMESMSNVPHYNFIRKPVKFGNLSLIDGLIKDGLTDAYSLQQMGAIAEMCVEEFKLSREEQDQYAVRSYELANKASKEGKFVREIVPIEIQHKQNTTLLNYDEDIHKVIYEKVPKLAPAFKKEGTVTAANASNLNDGAAALVLVSEEIINQYKLKPLAKILAYADAAQAPDRFTTSPAVAIHKALNKANICLGDVDFFEINEAYAAVALANQKLLDVPMKKINVYGGAVAIGHPLGASGARILTTLVSVLHQENGRYGVAAICNGGGGASAIIIEKC